MKKICSFFRFLLPLVVFFSLATVSLAAEICAECADGKGVGCSKRLYGFRRAYVPSATFSGGCSDKVDSNAEPFFRFISNFSEEKRADFIRKGFFGTKDAEKEADVASKDLRNVASFAFFFLNDDGKSVLDDKSIGEESLSQAGFPLFFRPDATEDNIKAPFLFFSGRRHTIYEVADDWDALPVHAVKEVDTSLLVISSVESLFVPDRIGWIGNGVAAAQIASLHRLQAFYLSEVKLLLWNACERLDFFDHVRMRRTKDQGRLVKREVCLDFLRECEPSVESIKVGTGKVHYSPLKGTGDFTHSEQFGLYRMRDHLESFMDRCLNIIDTRVGDIKKIVMLTYTRNTMCARCGHSIIADFCCTGDNPAKGYEPYLGIVKRKIADKLGMPKEEYRCDSLFMASALHEYVSSVKLTDGFEENMREEDPGEGDFTFNPSLTRGVASFSRGDPEVIFHHHLT